MKKEEIKNKYIELIPLINKAIRAFNKISPTPGEGIKNMNDVSEMMRKGGEVFFEDRLLDALAGKKMWMCRLRSKGEHIPIKISKQKLSETAYWLRSPLKFYRASEAVISSAFSKLNLDYIEIENGVAILNENDLNADLKESKGIFSSP